MAKRSTNSVQKYYFTGDCYKFDFGKHKILASTVAKTRKQPIRSFCRQWRL